MAKWVVRFHKLFIILDAIGLIVFSIIGCRVAMNMGLPAIICVVAAVVTEVFVGMLHFGIYQDLTIIVTLVIGFTMRMAAVQYRWSLPVFSLEDASGENFGHIPFLCQYIISRNSPM